MNNRDIYFRLQESVFDLAETIDIRTPANEKHKEFKKYFSFFKTELDQIIDNIPDDFYLNENSVESNKTKEKMENLTDKIIQIKENLLKQ